MKKTKKQKTSTLSKVLFLGALLLSLVSVGSIAKAKENSFVGWLYSLYTLEQSAPQVTSNVLKGSDEILSASSNRPIQLVYDFVNGVFVSGSQIFDSSANATLPGTLAVTGASTFTGAVTFNGAVSGISTSTLSTLTVTGTSTLAAVTASTTLTVTGATVLNGGLTMDTNKFTVADTSGNTAIGGTLDVTGNVFGLANLAVGTSTATYDLTVVNGANTSTVAFGTSEASIASRVCYWNGANYTVEFYPSNSTTKTVATSTLCQ